MKFRNYLRKIEPLSLIISGILIVTTLLFLFTPNILIFKQFEKYGTAAFTFLCFLSGIFFLFWKKEKLMFVALICCTLLSLYLRSSYGSTSHSPTETYQNKTSFSTALISLENANRKFENISATINHNDPDIIAFLDYMPDWHNYLSEELNTTYPHKINIPQLDFYGMGVYSKHPITTLDSFYYKGVPNLLLSIDHPNSGTIRQLVSNTNPVISSNDYLSLNEHLNLLATKSKSSPNKLIALGNYNIVPFSHEIQDFREKSNLEISSRSYLSPSKTGNLFYTPLDHIFHSKDINCKSLVELKQEGNHIGLLGRYTIK